MWFKVVQLRIFFKFEIIILFVLILSTTLITPRNEDEINMIVNDFNIRNVWLGYVREVIKILFF